MWERNAFLTINWYVEWMHYAQKSMHARPYACIQMTFLLMFKDARIVLIPISTLIVVSSVLFIRLRTIWHISDFCKVTFLVMKMKSHHKTWYCFNKLFVGMVQWFDTVRCFLFLFVCIWSFVFKTMHNLIHSTQLKGLGLVSICSPTADRSNVFSPKYFLRVSASQKDT